MTDGGSIGILRREDMDHVVSVVADHFAIPIEWILDKRRVQAATLPRHIAMYLLRSCVGASLTAIGRKFKRDHTTVLMACRKIDRLMLVDAETLHVVTYLQRKAVRTRDQQAAFDFNDCVGCAALKRQNAALAAELEKLRGAA
jgi:hypothetical protein